MIIYFNLKDGYMDGYGSTPNHIDGEIKLNIPDDHELFSNPAYVFRYVDGELVRDIEYQNQLIAETKEEANKPSDEEMNAIAIMELAEMTMLGGK